RKLQFGTGPLTPAIRAFVPRILADRSSIHGAAGRTIALDREYCRSTQVKGRRTRMSANPKSTPTSKEFDELKMRLKTTWMTGDYDVFSRFMEKDAEQFFRRLGI